MENQLFDVVYVDKFDHFLSAKLFRDHIRRRFKLTSGQIEKLSSGDPVRVKKQVSLDTAEKVRDIFSRSGGVCWVQPVSPTGHLRERRCLMRRELLDRRLNYRASSAFPDRRSSTGRREEDRSYRSPLSLTIS